MRVVSNAGPLIRLARAGHFDLLRLLFRRVLIPPGVYGEVAVQGRGQDGAMETASARWIVQRRPRRRDLVTARRGEAEAIALAAQRRGTLLLVDETLGRRVAARLAIGVKGTVGVLLESYRAGHVTWKGQSIGCGSRGAGSMTTWSRPCWLPQRQGKQAGEASLLAAVRHVVEEYKRFLQTSYRIRVAQGERTAGGGAAG